MYVWMPAYARTHRTQKLGGGVIVVGHSGAPCRARVAHKTHTTEKPREAVTRDCRTRELGRTRSNYISINSSLARVHHPTTTA